MKLVWWARGLLSWLILQRAIRQGLRIGKDVRITRRPYFGGEPFLISIGNHVTISFNVHFVNHDGGTWVFRDRPEYKGLQRFGRIDILDNCFIGANTTILPGVTIGPNVVVGAGSVVTRDLPANGVYGGVPARFICTLDEYVRRSAARCSYYPPEVASNLKRLRRVLMKQYPHPEITDQPPTAPAIDVRQLAATLDPALR
jgi:acetyltransferase-like isoleucine patch superfamily enzyme